MAKRFTDNEKWKDAWFMDLPSKYKLLWIYLLDDCNHAGIWKVNFKVASFYLGEHLEHSEVKRILEKRIEVLKDDIWYIKKFIKFQYNCEVEELKPTSKIHNSIINKLKEFEYFKPLGNPLATLKDKDKEIDIVIIDKYIKEISESPTYLEGLYRLNKLKVGCVSELLELFKQHLKVYPSVHNNCGDFKTHFASWLNIKNNKGQLSKHQKSTKGQL